MCSSESPQLLSYLQGHQVQSTRKDIEDSLPARDVLQDLQHPHALSHPLVNLQHSQSAGAPHNHNLSPHKLSRRGGLPTASQQTLWPLAAHTDTDIVESRPRSSDSTSLPAGPPGRPYEMMCMRTFCQQKELSEFLFSSPLTAQAVAFVCHPFSR